MAKLKTMTRLATGWDGYDAPAPSKIAVDLARTFIHTLARFDVLPRRVAPSVVGGVGVTQKRHGRKVYVEFFNDGKIFALISDGEVEPRTREVVPGYQSFRQFIAEMREYLNG